MTTASTALEPGIIIAGKLRVVRMLGAGGMGAVYEVEHQITKHRRALKLMHRGMALLVPDAVTRFLREASAAGRIGNPHIVETFDAGELPSGEPYIVMEMLQGRSLADLIVQGGPLDAALVADIMQQACDGVQAAHDAGIIHRDLKPENLFLVDGPVPLLKILDFGVSKFDPEVTGDARVTAEGATLGTPTYMAPEQLGGDGEIDARTDVYALGVVLYECLTGAIPYSANSLPELAMRIYEGRYAPLHTLRPELQPEFEAIVARAMARDKRDRFATVRELGAALGAFVPALPRSGVRSVVSREALAATGLASSQHPALGFRPKRSRLPWLFAALLLTLALGLALVLGRARPRASAGADSGPAAARPDSPPQPSDKPPLGSVFAPTAAPPSAAKPLAGAVVAPAEAQPSAARPAVAPSAAPPSAAAPQAPRETRPAAAPPDTKPKPRPRGSATRAHEHGLLEDNPF
jgi:eukaryotic-like serine/threonine-protein kinase